MNDDELLARLQAADPAASLPDAEPGRTARLLEETMSNDLDTDPARPADLDSRRRSPLTWLVAAAAVLVIAGVGVLAVTSRDHGQTPTAAHHTPTVMKLKAHAPGAAMCMQVTADTLSHMSVAFDGTVTSMSDGVVTLDVGHWYRGGDTDEVTVTAPPAQMHIILQAVQFEVGQRYLVTANNGYVTVCGFSALYSEDLAALYAQAFGSQ
jgi:hypothetical protein